MQRKGKVNFQIGMTPKKVDGNKHEIILFNVTKVANRRIKNNTVLNIGKMMGKKLMRDKFSFLIS